MSYNAKCSKNDEMMSTPKLLDIALKMIPSNINPGERIWEPFKGNGFSTEYMSKDREVTNGSQYDFFMESVKHSDLLVSNPPFSKKWEILRRLCELKPGTIILLIPLFSFISEHMKEIMQTYEIDLISMTSYTTFMHNDKPMKLMKPMLWVRFRLRTTAENFIQCKFLMDQDILKPRIRTSAPLLHVYTREVIFEPMRYYLSGMKFNINFLSEHSKEYLNEFSEINDENSTTVNFDAYLANRTKVPTVDFKKPFLWLVSCMRLNDLFKDYQSWEHPDVFTLFCYRTKLLMSNMKRPPFTLIWVTNIIKNR